MKYIMHLEIPSFYKCLPKFMITWHMVPEIWCTKEVRMDSKCDIRKGGCYTWRPTLANLQKICKMRILVHTDFYHKSYHRVPWVFFSMPWDLPHKIFCFFKLVSKSIQTTTFFIIYKILQMIFTRIDFKFLNYQVNNNETPLPPHLKKR